MTIDDYKELMRFYVLMSDKNLSDYKYAATDLSGHMFGYTDSPVAIKEQWVVNVDHESSIITSGFILISRLPEPPEDFTQALIEL